ncbi:MAG TPA: thiol:disulfide interchange protein DsbA/DsbL [Casimicrobiaceae bacterium]|jgi:thiol:disulfide interchange protein DsbA|nr:thiol:disulfide interchange protein DsbA/DsbL [Casimicrobiaceae bacterium]
MKRFKLQWLWILAWLAASAAWPADPIEGKDYVRLRNPQAVETGKKIEVIEFFSYGCPHCNDLEPILQAWMLTLPPDVQFRRVPVMFQQRWDGLAKIYYTLDAMGVEAKLSPEVFKAVHVTGLSLYEDKAFFDWAAKQGLDRARVAEVYGSFGVASKFNRAKAQAQLYNIQSVPTVIVDGKFVTSSDRVGTHAQLPPVLDALIVKARAERPKT